MKTLWVLFLCAFSLSVAAQVAPKCEDSFKVFEGRYLTKDYNDAYTLLKELRTRCPKINENLYVYGEAIFKYRIEVAQTPEIRKAEVNDLVALYGEYYSNFPAGGANVKKIQLQFENKLITKAEAYKAFDASFNKNKETFTDYNSLLAYYEMVLEDFKSKGISDAQYFQKYGDISTQVAYAKHKAIENKDAVLKKKETNTLTDAEKLVLEEAPSIIDALTNVADVIQSQSRDYISCDKMEEYYGKGYEAHKTDVSWLEAVATAMYGKKCFKSDVLQKAALALHTIKPTKETAFRLGMLGLKKGDNKEAVKYLEQAISLEVSPVRKSDVYIQLAGAVQHDDRGAAKKYLLKAVEEDPKAGDAYMQLAQLYATIPVNDPCNLSNFDKKVLNFLAIDAAKKAEIAEPKYKSAVASAIARYEKNKPTKEEAKVLGKKKGDTITLGCWINETVTLPNL